ncbi:hypothetical protein V1477_007851 [Vespula maculifrons]|uniref:Uncharacterized protein n=2 Tax=Vespula TaxID=7451 RepID=A0A834J4Q2_VESVU|nr:hypothetical protein HZH66_015210 [Vespula vulgaris]
MKDVNSLNMTHLTPPAGMLFSDIVLRSQYNIPRKKIHLEYIGFLGHSMECIRADPSKVMIHAVSLVRAVERENGETTRVGRLNHVVRN